MMSFLKYNKRKKYFSRRCSAFTIALMKMIAGIFVETILLVMISQSDNIEDIIKDFVALGFIIEIDNFLARNIDSKNIDEQIEQLKGKLIIEKDTKTCRRICWRFFKYCKKGCCGKNKEQQQFEGGLDIEQDEK